MKHPIDALIDDARELTRRALSVVPAPAAVDWAACPAAVWQSGLLGAGFVAHVGLSTFATCQRLIDHGQSGRMHQGKARRRLS